MHEVIILAAGEGKRMNSSRPKVLQRMLTQLLQACSGMVPERIRVVIGAEQVKAAPFRDRVVHHALMSRIEPPIDRRFLHDSYACRRNKGVHKAVGRYQHWSRRYRYALKIDIASYFASIDHALLKSQLRRVLKDRQTLNLLDAIIDGSLPPAQPPT